MIVNQLTNYLLKKSILKGLIDSNAPDQILKASPSGVVPIETATKPISTNGGEEITGEKRYRGKFATCDNCEEQYDVSNNHKGDCMWHDGMYLSIFSILGFALTIPISTPFPIHLLYPIYII